MFFWKSSFFVLFLTLFYDDDQLQLLVVHCLKVCFINIAFAQKQKPPVCFLAAHALCIFL